MELGIYTWMSSAEASPATPFLCVADRERCERGSGAATPRRLAAAREHDQSRTRGAELARREVALAVDR